MPRLSPARVMTRLPTIAIVLGILSIGCATPGTKASAVPAAVAPVVAAARPIEQPLKLDKAYFDYNQATLRPDARRELTEAVDRLLAHPDLRVNVEGYCDERGTDAYNVALGWKRAYAVRDYLKRMGVDDSRLFPISYGRSRPAVVGEGEQAWSLNRRVELTPRS